MGWTLTLAETKSNGILFGKCFIFGGFTTADWESTCINKPDPHSFLFSVNEDSKYPITGRDRDAIRCHRDYCAVFGGTGGFCDLGISSFSNNSKESWFNANEPSFKLPADYSSKYPSMNGGEQFFQLKQFEVYSVLVRININKNLGKMN